MVGIPSGLELILESLGRLALWCMLILTAGGCFSTADALVRFDRMVPPPGEEQEEGRNLLFQPLYLPTPWLLGLGSSRRRLEPCLVAMGKADDPPLVKAAALRLLFTLGRAESGYYRLLALASLGRLVARIGPGEPPATLPDMTDLPPLPELDRDFRDRLAGDSPDQAWPVLRGAFRVHLVRALHDPSEQVRIRAVTLFLRLWREEGARVLFRLAEASPVFHANNQEGLQELVYACGDLTPVQARAGGRETSVFAYLQRFTQMPGLVGDPHLVALQMVAMHAVCRILGESPRYDRAFFRTWWEKELAAWEEKAS